MTTIDKAVNYIYGRQGRFHTKEALFDLGPEGRMMPKKKENVFK